MNTFKTFILMGLLAGLFVFIGNLLGGNQGMFIALIIVAAMNFFSYWYSDKIVLKAYKAQEINADQSPELFNMVRELSQEANLPMPRVYMIPSDTPNAFATGRNENHAVVAVTRGIVKLLNSSEIRGVLAHELAHVKHRDILIGSITATMAGAIMMLAQWLKFTAIFGGGDRDRGGGNVLVGLLMAILAPLAAMLIQMWVSRSREYMADKKGAQITKDPLSLADALAKLEKGNEMTPMPQATPQTAHMFMVNPLRGKGITSWFSTHPPIADRISRLRGMAGQGGMSMPGITSKQKIPYTENKPVVPPKGKIDWS